MSIPFGNSQKYDLIIDYKNKLYKVQVKHALEEVVDGQVAYFSFKTNWQGHNNTGYTTEGYSKEDIDFFATYSQGNIYLVPVEECTGATKTLRIIPPANNQRVGINFANDYLAERILNNMN